MSLKTSSDSNAGPRGLGGSTSMGIHLPKAPTRDELIQYYATHTQPNAVKTQTKTQKNSSTSQNSLNQNTSVSLSPPLQQQQQETQQQQQTVPATSSNASSGKVEPPGSNRLSTGYKQSIATPRPTRKTQTSNVKSDDLSADSATTVKKQDKEKGVAASVSGSPAAKGENLGPAVFVSDSEKEVEIGLDKKKLPSLESRYGAVAAKDAAKSGKGLEKSGPGQGQGNSLALTALNGGKGNGADVLSKFLNTPKNVNVHINAPIEIHIHNHNSKL